MPHKPAWDCTLQGYGSYENLRRLFLEGLLDINLGNDAEAFAFESVNRLPHGLVEPEWQGFTEVVLHCGFLRNDEMRRSHQLNDISLALLATDQMQGERRTFKVSVL